MRITFVSLFPEFFVGPLGCSILGRAVAAGALRWDAISPREFARDRHRTTDDTPYGGGAGMVMRAPELDDAVSWAQSGNPGAPVALLSPQGRRFVQPDAHALAALPGLILVCGRYEGVDERFIERSVDLEISVGDFVLSGGEPAALCVVDAVARLLPGVLGNSLSTEGESFGDGLLEHPHFTRPASWGGVEVPAVLRGGDHERTARWRRKAALIRTRNRRSAHEVPTIERRDQALLDDASLAIEPWLTRARHLRTETAEGCRPERSFEAGSARSNEHADDLSVDASRRSCILPAPESRDAQAAPSRPPKSEP